MSSNPKLRSTLSKHLLGGQAFMPVDEMLKIIPFTDIHLRPKGLPYSFYELFYHIWFTQNDIIKYCTDSLYSPPSWPQDYWPNKVAPAKETEWKDLQKSFFEDRQRLVDLIDKVELNDYVPSNDKHSFFREILLVLEHTSYHSGQLLIILRHLGLHSS